MTMGNELQARGHNKGSMVPLNDAGSMLQATYDITQWPQIDYHDPNAVRDRIEQYFGYCAENNLVPLPSTLCLALGCTIRTLQHWRAGTRRCDPEILEQINKAWNLMIANLQIAGLTGRVQVIQALSIQHAMGVQDNPDKVAQEAVTDDRRQSASEIKQKYQDMDDMND